MMSSGVGLVLSRALITLHIAFTVGRERRVSRRRKRRTEINFVFNMCSAFVTRSLKEGKTKERFIQHYTLELNTKGGGVGKHQRA